MALSIRPFAYLRRAGVLAAISILGLTILGSATAASYSLQYVWPGGPYTKSAYLYDTSLCQDQTWNQWWHYQNISVTGYSNSVYVHSVTGTGGGDTGYNSPLYWGARYVYDTSGNSWQSGMPYPAVQHSSALTRTVNRTFNLSYTAPTYVDFYFGTLNGSSCTFVSWVSLYKY
jgi:hypothetical protein